MKKKTIFGREPALLMGLINSGIALLCGFGLELSAEQMALIVLFTSNVLSWIVRQKVEVPKD